MRITALKVDGFGVWSSLELSELSDQLTVFYGPNEAGKTTLMQFVRSVLYGFSPDRRARYLPPLGSGRPGGALQVVVGQDRYVISRHADLAGETGGVVVSSYTALGDGNDDAPDERAMAKLLGDVDEPTFNNVFAFGLREIQELGTLGDTQVADELYSLALGLDRVSLFDVLNELEASRNRLLAADDRPSLVTQLLGQRERLRDEIEDLSQATDRYLSLVSQRHALDAQIGRLEAEHERWERQSRELAVARLVSPRWQRRAAIDGQLQGLGTFDTLGENALARFERLTSRLAARRRRLARLKRQRRQLRAEITKLAINEPLCRQAPRLEALSEQQSWIRALESQVAKLEEEVLELESRRDESQKDWAAGPREAAARVEPLSQRALVDLRSAAKAWQQARRELRGLKVRSRSASESSATYEGKINAALGNAGEKGLTQALADAGQLVSQLRTRVQLDERLDQLSRRETQLEEQSHEHLENQILPTWALAGLGSLFVLGCALVLLFVAGMVLPASLSGALGWPVGLVGVLAAGSAGAIKFAMEHSAATKLDACHEQMQLLKDQIKQQRSERDQLDARLPRGGGPLVARLQSAEASLARFEALLPLEGQRDAAQREADAAANEVDQARSQCRAACKQWRRMLPQHGLPADILPRQLRSFSRQRRQSLGLGKLIDEKNGELSRRRAEYETLATRIRQLIGDAGIVPRSERPLDQLGQCLSELGEQQKLLKLRDELNRQLARLRRRRQKLARFAEKLRKRRRLLLESAGTSDEAEFRRRAHAQAEAIQLRAERAALAQEISAALIGVCAEEQMTDWLSGARNLEQLERELAASRPNAVEQLNEARERRGEMNEQLKMLVENRQLGHLRIELGIVERRLQDALDRWRVLAICGLVLGAVREYYEREHQPLVLREASVHLQRLTGGRYPRVWTPLGEHALRVDDSQTRGLKVEVLSRGTREQLFLALRLALVSSYARRGVALPLVLDDVLVNFDVGRAKAAALVLRDFARQGHQVLVFTCHEHISKLFKNIKADVRQLPERSQPRVSLEEQPPARRSRRARPEVPVAPASEPEYASELDVDLPAEEVVADTPEPAVETKPVEIRPATARAPGPIPPASAPPKAPEPPRQITPPAPAQIERARWSAEEFDGELTDRVRRTPHSDAWDREVHSDFDDGFGGGDDAEAAA